MAILTSSARQELIQNKAYELFLERGSKPGHEVEDWLAAEKIVDRELREAQRAQPSGERASARAPSLVGSSTSGRR